MYRNFVKVPPATAI